jgi:F-type H+-transporting ATPase subunit gamma
MANLKELRVRINSVKATRKITSAMKMVSSAKLRRAQEQAEQARPYADRMEAMLQRMAASVVGRAGAPPLLVGRSQPKAHLIVVATADRGLCGAFNSSIVREARRRIAILRSEGQAVRILCVGRRGRDQLRRDFAPLIVGTIEDVARPRPTFGKADEIARKIIEQFVAGEIDAVSMVFARFKSAMTQVVTVQSLIPFSLPPAAAPGQEAAASGTGAVYDYEPEEEEILEELLPRNIAVQIYKALLENNASEQGARMTAMDSATRNAGEMIGKLTLLYNRTRQAIITKELIEIVSAKEAM